MRRTSLDGEVLFLCGVSRVFELAGVEHDPIKRALVWTTPLLLNTGVNGPLTKRKYPKG
jgi:hypothetical protein